MRFRFPMLFCFASLVCVLGLSSTALAQSTGSSADPAAIKQLLDEVRELRLFLQKNGATAQRAQVLLERTRIQQQRVDGLTRDLDGVRQRVKELERSVPRAAENVALWEKKVELAETPNQRVDWEQAVRDLRRQEEQIKRDLQEYKDREVQLAARINVETTKLEELNSRLDIIERELDNTSADLEQPKTKKP